MKQCLFLLFIFAINTVVGDVIFTSERCNRATYGLRTVNGDPTRYKQCGPSGRVWIVPCAPLMTFDPQDRVCKERTETKVVKPMRKYELPSMIITTPAPSPIFPAFSPPSSTSAETGIEAKAPAEEFVFSTVRPKRPRPKARTRSKNKKTTVAMAETTTTPSYTPHTTTPKMIIFGGKKSGGGGGGPAFTRPGRIRTTTTTTTTPTPPITTTPQPIRQVTHATKFVPIIMQRTTGMPSENVGMPHTLAPYEKQEKRVDMMGEEMGGYGQEEKLTTMMPEYTVRYNGKVMTENQFLSQLLHIVQHQKAVAERQQQQKFEKMEQERLQQEREERDREIERRRRIEQAERERQLEMEKQAAIFAEQERLAMEREREVERIRQEERRREMEMRRQEEVERQMERQREMERIEIERARKNERIRMEIEAEMKQKELEMERQREIARQIEFERQQEMERRRQQEEEEHERLIKLRKEKAEREKAIMEEAQRREMEEQRRKEKERMEKLEMEEKRRQIEEERAELERVEKEKQMIRQIIENERNMKNQQAIVTSTPASTIKPIYRPQISEYRPPEVESQMIRFTTQSPEWVTSSNSWKSIDNWNTVEVEEPREPQVFQGCLINGECELKYDYDSFCQHPTNPSKYLQCAPLYGRNGRWTERQCPDTLEFVVSLGRCEKSAIEVANVRKPYDPDNRVIIPRLPSETAFIQWTGNRVIDFESNHNSQLPRVYPPVPETHQPHIYNTIEEFPRDLLPSMPENPNTYSQEYQNHIRGSVVSHSIATAPPIIPSSYRIPQSVPEEDNSLKSEIDLSHIHPLFPRVQPNFLSRIIPALNLKLQDDNGNQSLGSFMKPVIKEIALNQTEMFLDRLLADESVRKLLENEKDRLKSNNTAPN